MQPSIEGSVEQPPHSPPMYQSCYYLESNDIGAEGCSHLSKAQWTNLHTLYLCISRVII